MNEHYHTRQAFGKVSAAGRPVGWGHTRCVLVYKWHQVIKNDDTRNPATEDTHGNEIIGLKALVFDNPHCQLMYLSSPSECRFVFTHGISKPHNEYAC